MNKEKIIDTRREIEGFTHLPESLHETGLSLGAIGLLLTWLSYYQHGATPPLTRVASEENLADPEFGEILRELVESGVMPANYYNLALVEDREYLNSRGLS